MAKPKGLPKTGGRKKGAPNKKTQQWDELGAKIVGEGAERFMNVLDGLSDEDFTKNYLQILEYFKPKQQRTEIKGDIKSTVDISSMTTEELKQRAKAIADYYESQNTDTA